MVTPRLVARRDMDAAEHRRRGAFATTARLAAHGSPSKYSTRRGAEYASRCSMSARSPTWICSFSSTVGTGMTIANSFRSPWKSLAIVSTVRSSVPDEHDLRGRG